MDFIDKRKDALLNICIEDSKVDYNPPIIFLFGGKLQEKNEPASSVRAHLLNHISLTSSELCPYIEIAEDFKDWIHDSKYLDLLSFETDLAQTSSLIILILESPGAIGELGAFCINNKLKNKLIIILSESHYKEDSFINLGLLRQLDRNNIFSYSWKPDKITDTISDELDDISSDILDHLRSLDKTEKFNKHNNGHIALLIFELTRIFKALILKEIKEYLSILDIGMENKEIKRLLFILQKINLIEERYRGKQTYYLCKNDNQRLHFSKKNKRKPLDLIKSLTDTMLFYSENDKRRFKLIQEEYISRKGVK